MAYFMVVVENRCNGLLKCAETTARAQEREREREKCYCNSYGLYGTYIYIVIDSKAPWTFAVYLKPVMSIFIAHEMHFRKHANDISFSIYINSSIFLIHEHFSIMWMPMPIRTDGCFELHFSLSSNWDIDTNIERNECTDKCGSMSSAIQAVCDN